MGGGVTFTFYRKLSSLERHKTQAKTAEVHGLSVGIREQRNPDRVKLRALVTVLKRILKVEVILEQWKCQVPPQTKLSPLLICSRPVVPIRSGAGTTTYRNSWNSC